MTRRLTILFVLTLLWINLAAAQQPLTGAVDYPYLGIRLTIPEGWKGAESGEYLLLGSDTEPGLVGLTTNEATQVQELKTVADAGWVDEGIQMARSGDFEQVGAEGMGAEFSGTFQGQQAKAYIAGVINPHGNSVTLIALTTAEQYGATQKDMVHSLANSLMFALPKEAEHNEEWRQGLADHKLTYLASSHSSGTPYYDSSGQSYGSYSSYNSRSAMHLCSNGRFSSSSSSSSSFDAVGGFGGIRGGDGGDGAWEVTTSETGDSLLRLNFVDGSVSEYELGYREDKTYLNGTRYFRTDSDYCQ